MSSPLPSSTDSAEWQPPARGFWCDYATWWATVKIRWALSADQGEVDQLRTMLNTCATGTGGGGTGGGGGTTTTTTTAPPPPSGVGFGTMQCDAPAPRRRLQHQPGMGPALRNSSASPAALGGWRVSDAADNTYTIPGGFTLAAGAAVTLHSGSGTNTQADLYWGRTQHVWNNGGDTAYLRDGGGSEVASKTC